MGRSTPAIAPSEWQPTATGYERDGYRIVAIDAGGRYRWRLERRSDGAGPVPEWLPTSLHHTLRAAMYRAHSLEMDAIRSRRVVWRIALGAIAMSAALTLTSLPMSLAGFIVSVAAFTFGVRLLFEAAAIRFLSSDDTLIDSWARLERVALRLIDAISARPPQERVIDDPKVRVLPPLPGGTTAGSLTSPRGHAEPSAGTEEDDEPIPYRPASPMHIC